MATLIVTDIHGNLPALQAVLATPEARSCTDMISLGDHVNFGPQSREVHQLLLQRGAVMLLGNHEERLTRPGDSDFDGYNWALMRWTARQMAGISLHLPKDLQRGTVLFTHGTPSEPYHLVYPADLPGVLETLPQGVQLLVSGHNHILWDVTHQGRRAFNPGSLGMAEDGQGGVAPFAVLEGDTLYRFSAAYDPAEVKRAYLATGACRVAPQLCRACLRVMQTGEYQGVLRLIRHVSAQAAATGLTLGDEAAWRAADQTYDWAEPMPSDEYWNQAEDDAC